MANIGISKASYYADTSLVRFTNEGVKSVDRLSSAQSDVVNGEIATLSGMNYTFKMDVAAAKASIKSLSTTQAYLTTAITALDNASHTLSQIQELAVLGANGSNSEADHAAFNARAEELADQFHNVMSGSKYKNEHIFDPKRLSATMANGSGGSIDFGLAEIDYDFFYDYKNPEISILNDAVTYEITRELTDDQKNAILSKTSGLTAEQLVVGFQFTTNPNPTENVGDGSMSMLSELPPVNNTKTYNRNDGAVRFDDAALFSAQGEFNGGKLEVEISRNSEDPDSITILGNDSISLIGDRVFYDDPVHGSLEIGQIDSVANGQNGSSLIINLHSDATVPGTSNLLNGNFEAPLRQQGGQPRKTYTTGEHRDGIAEGYAIVNSGVGYTQRSDQASTNLARGSDTYSLEFVNKNGGSGSGFRAHVNVLNDGSVEIVEVLDKGQGYQVGDIIGLDDTTELGGNGVDFSIRITDIVNADPVGQGTQGVERVTNPNWETVDVIVEKVGDGSYPWGENWSDGDFALEETDNEDPDGSVNYYRWTENGNYDFGDITSTSLVDHARYDAVAQVLTYQDQDVKLTKIEIGDQQNTDTVVYEQDINGDTIIDEIAVGMQQAGDTAIYALDNAGDRIVDRIEVGQNINGDRAITRTDQIAIEDYQAGDTPIIDGTMDIAVGQQQPGDRAVYAKVENLDTYPWGEIAFPNDDLLQAGNGGITSYYQWSIAGEYAVGVAGGMYDWDVAGTDFDVNLLNYNIGDRVLERSDVGGAGWTAVNTTGEVPSVAFYYREKTLETEKVVSHYERDNITGYTRDVITHYERDRISHYERERVAFYLREQTLRTKQVVGQQVEKYLGETQGNQQAHTGWEQDTTEFIPNWTKYDGRINFGNSFTINDTQNGTLISSSLVDGSYTDNSVNVAIPTPQMADMFEQPTYEYEGRTADPAIVGTDNSPLTTNPNGSVDLIANQTDGIAGSGVKLATGDLVFDSGNEFGVYHGPAIVSDVFRANKDQFLKLDYSAAGDKDDFHVTGYIYNVNDPNPDLILAIGDTGTDGSGRKSVLVPETGDYRFVFIVGTYDKTGGLAAGADMTIDNIRAENAYSIEENAIQALLRAVHYENSSDTATADKILTATVNNFDGTSVTSDDALINMSGFNTTGDGGPYMVAPSNDLVTNPESGVANGSASALTSKVELLQQKIDALRTQAGSKVSAIESAIDSATDLRSQFALASGTLSDVNFSLETVHAAKRQIQQDVAAAMMAQANKAQDGMLSLVAEAETKP